VVEPRAALIHGQLTAQFGKVAGHGHPAETEAEGVKRKIESLKAVNIVVELERASRRIHSSLPDARPVSTGEPIAYENDNDRTCRNLQIFFVKLGRARHAQEPLRRVDLRNHYGWWVFVHGANWRHPRDPASSM